MVVGDAARQRCEGDRGCDDRNEQRNGMDVGFKSINVQPAPAWAMMMAWSAARRWRIVNGARDLWALRRAPEFSEIDYEDEERAVTPVLIGYFPKQIERRPSWLKAPQVELICSVSECVSSGPDDWMEPWIHTDFGTFKTEDDAWQVVPGGRENPAFELLAYRMFPAVFELGAKRERSMPSIDAQPLAAHYFKLGYDCVVSAPYHFECSPLSCNHAAEEIPTNRYCLLDDLDEALRHAATFSDPTQDYEPGAYVVIEIWAETRIAALSA